MPGMTWYGMVGLRCHEVSTDALAHMTGHSIPSACAEFMVRDNLPNVGQQQDSVMLAPGSLASSHEDVTIMFMCVCFQYQGVD